MKAFLTILLTIFILSSANGQSPFNYGQNKSIYFISTELRNKLDIKEINTIKQSDENENGEMRQKWSLSFIDFDTSDVSDSNWEVIRDSTFKDNYLEGLTTENDMFFMYERDYQFRDGQLEVFGVGSHSGGDRNYVTRLSDTISITATHCVRCGDQPVIYSKNVFNKMGQLIYAIRYPAPSKNEEEPEVSLESLEECEKFLNTYVTAENTPDTIQYRYDNKGLLFNIDEDNTIKNINEAKTLFTNSTDLSIFSEFHQCYVGEIEMEKFFLNKIGYTPELLLIEIYRQAVYSFHLNQSDKKYYQAIEVMLEK